MINEAPEVTTAGNDLLIQQYFEGLLPQSQPALHPGATVAGGTKGATGAGGSTGATGAGGTKGATGAGWTNGATEAGRTTGATGAGGTTGTSGAGETKELQSCLEEPPKIQGQEGPKELQRQLMEPKELQGLKELLEEPMELQDGWRNHWSYKGWRHLRRYWGFGDQGATGPTRGTKGATAAGGTT
uniref:Uncharacterized protein n=1 Tax=Amphimedon queenslandica TaxID=400682 RepID=A0A1X7TRL7_AMPQE